MPTALLSAPWSRLVIGSSLGGAAIALSGPPTANPPIAFVGIAFLYATLWTTQVLRPERAWRAFLGGWLCGTVCNLIALRWAVGMLEAFGGFPWIAAAPTALLLFMAQGLPLGFATFITANTVFRPWLVLPLAISVTYTLTPAIFPWRPAVTQVPWLAWAQLAEVGGEPILDALWALVGCAGAHACLTRSRLAFQAFLLALILPVGYGSLRIPAIEEERSRARSWSVGIVQPNEDIFDKMNPSLWYDQLETLQELTVDLESQGADMVVWPENAYPFRWPRHQQTDLPGSRRILANGVEGPLIFGGITVGGRCEMYNSIIGLDTLGRVVGVSDKVELLIFGEYVPLWHEIPLLQDAFACPGVTPGTEPRLMTLAGARIGPLNCYEDVLAEFARQVTRQSPDFLVNVTNDAWFGDTAEPYLHQQVARLRSIETRRDLVRSVNTGVSSHITATGAETVHTESYTRVGFLADVRSMSRVTPWVRYGDIFTPAFYLTLWWLFWVRRRNNNGPMLQPRPRAASTREE